MIIPILHRIIVKPDNFEEIDETARRAREIGIEIARNNNLRYQDSVDMGHVVAIGPTAFKDFGADCPLKVGDYITYARNVGKKITDPDNQQDYLALNDEDVVAILNEVTSD